MGERKDKGKIIVRESKKGKLIFEVDLGTKQPMTIPSFYDLKDNSLNGKECEVIRENGKIKKIMIDGKELPKKEQKQNVDNLKKESSSYQKKKNFKENKLPQNIFSMSKTKLPNDTKKRLIGAEIDNFSLKLNKCVNFFYNNDKQKEEVILYKSEYKDKSDNNKKKKFEIEFNFDNWNSIVEKFKNDFSKIKENFTKMGYTINEISLSPDWRLIVGLGNPSVYETLITLHHIYGIPYIPGSAIKGVVRSYFIRKEFEKTGCKLDQINIFEKVLENIDLKKDTNLDYKEFKKKFLIRGKEVSNEIYSYFCKSNKEDAEKLIGDFRIIFGTQSTQGKIVFFDAYPKTEPKIKIDVMNPHYSDYYGGKKDDKENSIPPADYLSPSPIYFLTVEDTQFEFCLGSKEIYKNYLDEAKNLLLSALQKHGIGAKTSVGYGYMK